MITQMTSWQVVENDSVVNKPHLGVLVDNEELDILIEALGELPGTPKVKEMYDRLFKLAGTIPKIEPLGFGTGMRFKWNEETKSYDHQP